nr:MAG TPA: hypothetical protein [Caudoviricetes sp.]
MHRHCKNKKVKRRFVEKSLCGLVFTRRKRH